MAALTGMEKVQVARAAWTVVAACKEEDVAKVAEAATLGVERTARGNRHNLFRGGIPDIGRQPHHHRKHHRTSRAHIRSARWASAQLPGNYLCPHWPRSCSTCLSSRMRRRPPLGTVCV